MVFDFDNLPERFVLKYNQHFGLGMRICKDNFTFHIKYVKVDLQKGVKRDYYLSVREWLY